VLGVNVGDPLTNLQVNLQTRDLGEFDQLLQTLAFEGNGKKGAAAIPVVLHGNANFVGTAKGAIRNLDVKGHVTANDLVLQASEFGSRFRMCILIRWWGVRITRRMGAWRWCRRRSREGRRC
jgi:hypothetical protein